MRIFKGALLALALLLGMSLVGAEGSAWARQSMSFSPHGGSARVYHGSRARSHARSGRSRVHGRAARHGRERPHGVSRSAGRPAVQTGGDEGDAAKAVPGKGFTLDNGVLTYPAPARFQPKALNHR